MQEQTNYHLNITKQTIFKFRIHLFALCYLVSMVSYSAITTMMYSLYNRYQLRNVALVNGIFAFIGFGPTNMIVLHILRKLNLKRSLALGFVGLMCYNLNIMLTVISIDKDVPIISSIPVIYVINIVTSFLAGVSNSLIWTVMPTYIQAHCDQIQPLNSETSPDSIQDKNSITAMMGLFWSIQMWSAIIGGILNIFLLGFSSSYIYMVILISISCASIFMVMLFVQPFQVNKIQDGYNVEQLSLKEGTIRQFNNLIRILKQETNNNNGFPNIFIYNFIAGFFLNFYPIFMNKIIQKSLPIDTPQQDFSRLTATVFIFQGIGCMLMGVFQNKLYFLVSKNKQKALMWGFQFLLIIMFCTMYTYNIVDHTGSQYWLCIVLIFGWAVTQIHIKTNSQAYIRQYNGGKVQYYSLSILFYSLGSILNYTVQMVDSANYQMILIVYLGITVYSVWVVRQPGISALNLKADLLRNQRLITITEKQDNADSSSPIQSKTLQLKQQNLEFQSQ